MDTEFFSSRFRNLPSSMRNFLAFMFRCLLALSLVCLPVANAFAMGAMTASQGNAQAREDVPPCHTSGQDPREADGKCCGVGHCHCAMANALPVDLPVVAARIMPSDHPQTVRPLTLQQSVVPDTPPPRA
jgi:hypothetical protein